MVHGVRFPRHPLLANIACLQSGQTFACPAFAKATSRAIGFWRQSRLLTKHGYPPDLQDGAVRTVIEQAERILVEIAGTV